MRIELYKKLCANFNKPLDEDLYQLWNEELGDIDSYYVEVAIKNIIKKDTYFPTLNRILEVLKSQPFMEIPQEEKIKRMKAMGIIPNWLKDYDMANN